MGCAKVRISTLSIETIEQGNVEMFVVTAGRVRARYFHDREKIKIVGPPLEMAPEGMFPSSKTHTGRSFFNNPPTFVPPHPRDR